MGNMLAGFKALLGAGEATVVGPEAWGSVLEALTSQISVTTVVGVLAAVVAAGIGLVFMWWGVRKVSNAVMRAFKSGKLKL